MSATTQHRCMRLLSALHNHDDKSLSDYETQSGLICICGMERYVINYTS